MKAKVFLLVVIIIMGELIGISLLGVHTYKKDLVIFNLSFKEKFNRIIETFVKSRKNTYFLKHGVFEYRDKFQLPDSHPNKEGHALIAKNLLNYITKTNIIPYD